MNIKQKYGNIYLIWKMNQSQLFPIFVKRKTKSFSKIALSNSCCLKWIMQMDFIFHLMKIWNHSKKLNAIDLLNQHENVMEKKSKTTTKKTTPKKKTIWNVYSERGRPRKYKDEKEWNTELNKYFDFLIDHDQKPTITGLCLFMGFSDRRSFYDYEKTCDFSHAIKRSRLLVEHHYEQLIQTNNNTGAIFALKNMGWHDKQQVEQTITEQKQVFKIGDQIISFD